MRSDTGITVKLIVFICIRYDTSNYQMTANQLLPNVYIRRRIIDTTRDLSWFETY